jgi:uncharacterized membrane protein YheB (UPF0754 family)
MDWNEIMTVLNYISGPLIGALIGYITNFIAVKMLFHPYKPIKIFGLTLPFTPGIIPRRKPKLAKAISNAVGNELFTEDDLKEILISNKIKETVSDAIYVKAEELISKTPMELSLNITSEEKSLEIKDKTCALVTDKIIEGAREIDIGAIISERGADVIKEKRSSLGMFGMFITDELINSLLEQLKDKVNEFIDTDGSELIRLKAEDKLSSVYKTPISQYLEGYEIDKDLIKNKIEEIYEVIIKKSLSTLKGKIDIASVVERKVNDMSVKELEALCLSVMKRELGAVINLGALIGFVIGIINIFI